MSEVTSIGPSAVELSTTPEESVIEEFRTKPREYISRMTEKFGIPCWELKNCGRWEGGPKAEEFGVCVAYPFHGWSCWAVAGTLCGGVVQGSAAAKEGNCQMCAHYNTVMENDPAKLKADSRYFSEVMQNLTLGLFTVNPKGMVDFRASKKAQLLMGLDLAGKNLAQLLFPDDAEMKKSALEWFDFVFMKFGDVDWDVFDTLCPMKEVKFKGMWLKFIWSPFIRDGNLFRLLVQVQDITHEKELEIELATERAQNEQILEIIKDLDFFEEYVSETKAALDRSRSLLEKLDGAPAVDTVDELFRMMHSVKGGSAMFKLNELAEEAHRLEDFFGAMRKQMIERRDPDERIADVDAIIGKVGDIEEMIAKVAANISKITNKDFGVVRGGKKDIRLNVALARLMELEKKCRDEVGDCLLLSEIHQLTLVPAKKLLARFPRMVSSLSEKFGKMVQYQVEGENIPLDAETLDLLGDPMVHIIRNSMDHGIESPEEREEREKNPEGVIVVSVRETPKHYQIIVKDDGRGLDRDKIIEKAVRNGLLTRESAEKLDDNGVHNLIFLPGFSTKEQTSTVSGRGVGMDVVKTNVEKLDGSVIIGNNPGQGMTLTMEIPKRRKSAVH